MAGPTITVAAASSLVDVLPKIGAAFGETQPGGANVRFSFAASGVLARQVQSGAPFDVFIAAGEKEVNQLVRANAVRAATRAVFATNRLVLVRRKSGSGVVLRDWSDLARLPDGARLVLGNPDTVPAGRYARETLTKRGLWNTLSAKKQLVFVGSVRQALTACAAGNADAALVFATDAKAEARTLRVVATAKPGSDHQPIEYIAVVTRQAESADAATAFVQFLKSETARRILVDAGFLR